MSDEFNDDLSSELSAAVVQITDSAGVPDDADDSTAVPNALADQVEDYQEFAERRDEHLAQQLGDDEGEQQHPQGNGKRNVPLGALQDERAKRQTAQAQVAELQQQLAAHQAQLQQFQQWQQQVAAQQQQAQQEQPVDFDEDPRGYIEQKERQFAQALANIQGAQQQQHFQAQAADAMAYAGQAEEAFRVDNPDYDAAFAHVQASADQQLRAMYPQASEVDLQLAQQGALLDFVRHCRVNGINPAAQIMQKAQQLGFQPQHRAPRFGKSPPTSLSTLPGDGKAPDQKGTMNARSVATMSNQEFDEFFESMRAAEAPRFGF